MTEETETELATEVAPIAAGVNDVDKSWDGTGSLDEHREKVLKDMKQPGFGQPKAN